MKIVEVRTSAHRLPPSVPWEDATNKVQGLEFVVVELVTDTGLVGTGFSYTVDIGGTSIAALVEDYLAALVIGMDPLDYERIWLKLQRQSRRLGVGVNSMAIAAIDVGVWDLVGKFLGQPLYRLFGGTREAIPAYISEINLAADDTVEDLLARVDDYMARGYRTVKIKIGRPDIEDDVERIVRVRERLGRGGGLLVDLNQKWSAREALVKAGRIDGLGLGWIEEPLLFDDIPAHVALKRAIRTPIALGESLHSRAQFLDYLRADAIDFVQADVAFVGGLTEWLKIAHLAQIFGRPVAPHYMMELSLHMLCGVSNGFMLENVIGGSFTELGLLEEPIVVEGAMGHPPLRPGHGIVFDRAALDRVRLDPQTLKRAFAGGSK
ncbi:mandelate racemase/muconate lactonizing enzyme family protein [Siculibacillus lacustris]|uniref:Mandelate racemase/muconate lactonizing enzyme family protein n=1 Tax=Siculibacillus lacustris TaxID=1549641 RepID=A0A4Q9VTR2_9HYPH|nr:mandelate racemase/muconate lactonizing enzyme family protein [Siculibacillus lacustris]TBW39508.1 mandelate racemase/muconate lactonizing enzyme family protein [Siculibacillus lacustris]